MSRKIVTATVRLNTAHKEHARHLRNGRRPVVFFLCVHLSSQQVIIMCLQGRFVDRRVGTGNGVRASPGVPSLCASSHEGAY
ncbi:hypothetical protein JTE90_017794 [Oedothorax gibbosus]|uniref:Uncharacterized protein n=1 Tax=Oedothorax gibbosus TaxID=931172 RepID=A0AAV6U655_9ARAC|nr:hypothetical protein JTE90_017794 [Oedothorax gibbosus]